MMAISVPAIVVLRNFSTHFKTLRYPSFTRPKNRSNQYLPFGSLSIAMDSNVDESMGTSVTARSREAIRENDTASASGVNRSDAMPSTYTIGKNTTKVVVVEAITAGASSDAPFVADSNKV